ncbi:CCC motif membrane protein [Ichthyenterobacterium magnum]|uniref:DUF4190 domain-containing protein n=1 Tax=Ichthyenterobacterium magnum TaxID=1230530 RepID=A0A420DWH1_9FLAO|nr:CCC motif membrane protein [Ichthyenterobacterium magnum]RKE98574.1 hypothetical protein BXY80_0664 [Ichthyenterobacterium magnum]
MNYNKLPADPTALILGILGLVIGIAGCCCYGVLAIVPLTLGIIGLVMANKSLREFVENPEAYSPQSRSNVATAKVLNIIAIIFNGLIMIVFIILFVVYGTFMSTAIMEGIKQSQNEDYYEWENDSLYDYEEDDYIIEQDTIEIDSIKVEEVKEFENLEN